MDFEQGCLESDCERERLQEKVQIDNSRELQFFELSCLLLSGFGICEDKW